MKKHKKHKKRIAKYSVLPAAGALMFFSFNSNKNNADVARSLVTTTELPESYTVALDHSSADDYEKVYPVLEKDYLGFKEAIAFRESQGNYQAINQFGYLGKYQFAVNTLKLVGIYNTRKFLLSPQLQEAVFYANSARNKWILQREIVKYAGTKINGIEITESGILAAAHLAGPGSIQRYLKTNGAYRFADAFGTSIGHYLRSFKGYDTSLIQPKQYPKALEVLEEFYTEDQAEWVLDPNQ